MADLVTPGGGTHFPPLYAVGVGYTLATGRLYCDFAAFQKFASDLLGRPLMTHEFADTALWDELRTAFEIEAEAEVSHAG